MNRTIYLSKILRHAYLIPFVAFLAVVVLSEAGLRPLAKGYNIIFSLLSFVSLLGYVLNTIRPMITVTQEQIIFRGAPFARKMHVNIRGGISLVGAHLLFRHGESKEKLRLSLLDKSDREFMVGLCEKNL